MLVLSAAVACNQAPGLVGNGSDPAVAAATTPSLIPTQSAAELSYLEKESGMTTSELDRLRKTDPDKYRYFEALVKQDESDATKAALAPQTYQPGPPPTYTPSPLLPTPTLAMGAMFSCQVEGHYRYSLIRCWRMVFNGEVVSVATGIDEGTFNATSKGATPIPEVGVVAVFNGPDLLYSDRNPEIYRIPGEPETEAILSVDGTHITLAPMDADGNLKADGARIVFDLATHQFVSP